MTDVFDRVDFTDYNSISDRAVSGVVRDVIRSEVGPNVVGVFYVVTADDGQLWQVDGCSWSGVRVLQEEVLEILIAP